MLPVVKNLLYVTIMAGYEKRISTELYTSDSDSSTLTWSESSRVQQRYTCAMIGTSWVTRKVVHALWLGQASWVTRKVVCMHVVAVLRIVHEFVSCESRIVHMFYYLCLYSLHLLHRTLYRRTHSLPFFCASNVYTTSDVPALAPCVKTCVKKFAKNLAKNLQVPKNSKGKIFLANMLEMVC